MAKKQIEVSESISNAQVWAKNCKVSYGENHWKTIDANLYVEQLKELEA